MAMISLTEDESRSLAEVLKRPASPNEALRAAMAGFAEDTDNLEAHARELTRQLHEARQELQHYQGEARRLERQLRLERSRGGRRGGR